MRPGLEAFRRRRKLDVVFQIQLRLGIARRLEVEEEIVLNGEDGVGSDPGVVAGVELGGHGLEAFGGDHEMDVSWAHRVAVQDVQEDTGGTVGGQRVGGRVVAVVVVTALSIGAELATEVVGRLVLGVLEVVLAIGGGLPDVDDGVRDGLLRHAVDDLAVHEGNLAVGDGILDDAVAESAERSLGRPEGAENGGGGGNIVGVEHDVVGDFVDETN